MGMLDLFKNAGKRKETNKSKDAEKYTEVRNRPESNWVPFMQLCSGDTREIKDGVEVYDKFKVFKAHAEIYGIQVVEKYILGKDGGIKADANRQLVKTGRTIGYGVMNNTDHDVVYTKDGYDGQKAVLTQAVAKPWEIFIVSLKSLGNDIENADSWCRKEPFPLAEVVKYKKDNKCAILFATKLYIKQTQVMDNETNQYKSEEFMKNNFGSIVEQRLNKKLKAGPSIRVVGRIMRGSESVGYRLVNVEGTIKDVRREDMIQMVYRGLVMDCELTDREKMTGLTGINGLKLAELPKINLNKV